MLLSQFSTSTCSFSSLSLSQALPLLFLLAAAIFFSCCSCSRVAGKGVIRNGALKRDRYGAEMDTHDGNVVQFAPGGPFYMYR